MKKQLLPIENYPTSAQEELDFDTHLLNQLEIQTHPIPGIIRTWEPQNYAIVLGKSNKIKHEVNLEACQIDHIPIIKRDSGGGAVLLGPGCLCYTLIIHIPSFQTCKTITSTNETILTAMIDALSPLNLPIQKAGYTDLIIDQSKISGNAQKRKKNYLLFHGTILYNINIELIHAYLQFPSKYPEYRKNRTHKKFVRNINFSYSEISTLLNHYFANRTSKSDDLKELNKILDPLLICGNVSMKNNNLLSKKNHNLTPPV